MGNNVTTEHPLTELNKDKIINLKRYIPEKEWWTVWHFIFTGKKVKLVQEQN
jgi:hypothetical protein